MLGQNRGPTELDRFTDPISLVMIGLHREPNMTDFSFVFVVYFIRAYLRGASFGSRLSGVLHGPIPVQEMTRVRH